jgi:hypothetical protein
MENNRPGSQIRAGLPIGTYMINHRGEVGSKFRKKLEDFVKPPVDRVKAGPQRNAVGHGVGAGLPRVTFKHPVKVFRLPPESQRQGFERAAATAALNGMPLDFPHDSCRDMRTLRKLALTPAKLADTVANSPTDRSPVVGIAFRHARSSAFHFHR